MGDASDKKKGIMDAVMNAGVVQIILYPVFAVKDSIVAIKDRYQLPENITHLFFMVSGIFIATYSTFGIPGYEPWLGNIISSIVGINFGSTATGCGSSSSMAAITTSWLRVTATWIASIWTDGSIASLIAAGGNKIVRKIFFGDWDYRLTDAECLRIVDKLKEKELAVDTTEVRKIFTYCVKYYRNPPELIAGTQEEFQKMLKGLFEGKPEAIWRYEDQQLLWAKLKKRYATRHARIRELYAASERSLDVEDGVALDSLQRSDEQSSHSYIDTKVPQNAENLTTQPIEQASVELGQLPSQTAALTAHYDRYIRRVERVASITPQHQRKKTFEIRCDEIERIQRRLSALIPLPVNIQGQQRIEREELIRQALALRSQIISQRQLGDAAAEAILQQHLATISRASDAELHEMIRQDQRYLDEQKGSTKAKISIV